MEASFRPHRGGTVIAFGIAGLFASLPLCKTSQQASKTKASRVVSAHLLFEDHTIPAGARILLVSTKHLLGSPRYAAEVGADPSTGHLEFDHVPEGKYTLVARWEPKKNRHREDAGSSPSSETIPATDPVSWGFCWDVTPGSEDHEIILSPGSRQSILVKTETGEPGEDVRAVLALRASKSFVSAPGVLAEPTLTLERHIKAKDGHLVLDGLAPGEWTCVFSISGYGRTAELSLEVPATTEQEIVVPRFLSVAGEVHAPEGVSVAKVWVGLEYDPTYAFVPADGQVATSTDESGRFTISDARPGSVKLKAQAELNHTVYMGYSEMVLEPGKDLKDVRIDVTKSK
jgi:hypothetical protein